MRQPLAALRAALTLALLAGVPCAAEAQNGRVSGLVNDEDGHPLKAATIIAEFPDAGLTMTATTDDKGRFTMIGLRSGRWTFVVQAPGYAPTGGSLPIRSGSPNPALAFQLQRRGNVSGPLSSVNAKDLQTELTSANALFADQKWDAAIAAYREILGRVPGLAMVNLQIAAAFINKKDYPGAAAAYNDLLKVDPANSKAAAGLASVALAQGDIPAAEEALTKVTETPAAGREVFCSLGDVEMAKGDLEAATRWYRKAAESDPAWGRPLYQLAQVALKSGDQATALTLMDKVVAVDPESPEAAMARTSLAGLRK